MRLIKKVIGSSEWQVHPDAKSAYLFTTRMEFQLSKDWSQALNLDDCSLPWALYDKNTKKYLVFSQWKSLLPSRLSRCQKRPVLIWPVQSDIEIASWSYVAELLNCSLSRKTILYRLANLLDVISDSLRNKISNGANGSSSLESLTRFYGTCSNNKGRCSHVRVAVERYLKEKD